MTRPADTYTHSQFAVVDPSNTPNRQVTVLCLHCKKWRASAPSVWRKKEHLLKCPEYHAWREAGNGQDLPPPNTYNKRETLQYENSAGPDQYHHQEYAPGAEENGETATQPPLTRPEPMDTTNTSYTQTYTKNLDIVTAFEEFTDESHTVPRIRCRYCGQVRARNSTRQYEHLQQCRQYLDSIQSQHRVPAPTQPVAPMRPMAPRSHQDEIWRGNVANPNLVVRQNAAPGVPIAPARSMPGPPSTPQRPMGPPPPPQPAPSLANHLLGRDPDAVTTATQQRFLCHAGSGSLSAAALMHWLSQDSHISRGFVSFVGTLIGKTRLPDNTNTQQNTTYRAMDLLISTLNNVRREMSFFETTAQKYNLQVGGEEPTPATKGYLDLFASASSPGASLLEGMVLLWVTEHCYRASWHYASTFISATPTANYSLPSYLTGGHDPSNPYGSNGTGASSSEAHINALHQAFIPNWTSPAFSKFVDACRAIIDEMANAQTSGNGREEMARCELVFTQALWLWGRLWPEVNGMGESDDAPGGPEKQPTYEATPGAAAGDRRTSGAVQSNGKTNEPIEIADDDDDEDAQQNMDVDGQDDANEDSPYDTSYGGLEAVRAANEAS